jgi:hypothetical protein
MVGDVFEKAPGRLTLADDAGNVWPQVARIIGGAFLTGDAEGLAGISGSKAINFSTPACAIEGSHIRPDRRLIQLSCFHMRDKEAGDIGFPLDITNGMGVRHSEPQAKLKPARSGTKSQHMHAFFLLRDVK